MTVTLTNHLAGDSLSLNAAALLVVDDALTVNYDSETGVLTIGGEASVADYQTILQGVQYDNTSQNPDVTPRVIDVVVNDGLTDSAVNTSTISVTAVNDAPEPPLITGIASVSPAVLEGVQGYAGYGPIGNQFGGNFLHSPAGLTPMGGPSNVVTLTLDNLPEHTTLNLGFLFAAIDSLDGSGTSWPQGDYFNVKVDGVSIFQQSFANGTPDEIQSYTGVALARQIDLGFSDPGAVFPNSPYTDSAYNLGTDPSFQNIPHTASSVTITFQIEGPGIQELSDELWAIDNLSVSVSNGTDTIPVFSSDFNGSLPSQIDPGTLESSVTNDPTPTVSGLAEPNSLITIYEGATPLGPPTPADSSGHWTFTPSTALSEGSHALTATATADGNVSGRLTPSPSPSTREPDGH